MIFDYGNLLLLQLSAFSRHSILDKSLKAAMIPKIYQMANSAGKNYGIYEISSGFTRKLLDFRDFRPYFAVNQVAIGKHRANIRIRMRTLRA